MQKEEMEAPTVTFPHFPSARFGDTCGGQLQELTKQLKDLEQ